MILEVIKDFSIKLKKLQAYLKETLIWNSTLRFVLQQFSLMLISSVINLYFIDFDSKANGFCSILCFVIIVLLIFTLFTVYWISRKYEGL